jgi:hypothetical protein
MTEDEWLNCIDSKPMLEFLRGKASIRKLRLFTCACCQHSLPYSCNERSCELINIGTQLADGLASEEMLRDALQKGSPNSDLGISIAISYLPATDKYDATTAASSAAWVISNSRADYIRGETYVAVRNDSGVDESTRIALVTGQYEGRNAPIQQVLQAVSTEECRSQATLVREVFGNPFRSGALIPLSASWRTPLLSALARRIYDEGAFNRLPVLAALLAAAGFDDQELLAHCLSSGPHVRGCWALDLILGKE